MSQDFKAVLKYEQLQLEQLYHFAATAKKVYFKQRKLLALEAALQKADVQVEDKLLAQLVQVRKDDHANRLTAVETLWETSTILFQFSKKMQRLCTRISEREELATATLSEYMEALPLQYNLCLDWFHELERNFEQLQTLELALSVEIQQRLANAQELQIKQQLENTDITQLAVQPAVIDADKAKTNDALVTNDSSVVTLPPSKMEKLRDELVEKIKLLALHTQSIFKRYLDLVKEADAYHAKFYTTLLPTLVHLLWRHDLTRQGKLHEYSKGYMSVSKSSCNQSVKYFDELNQFLCISSSSLASAAPSLRGPVAVADQGKVMDSADDSNKKEEDLTVSLPLPKETISWIKMVHSETAKSKPIVVSNHIDGDGVQQTVADVIKESPKKVPHQKMPLEIENVEGQRSTPLAVVEVLYKLPCTPQDLYVIVFGDEEAAKRFVLERNIKTNGEISTDKEANDDVLTEKEITTLRKEMEKQNKKMEKEKAKKIKEKQKQRQNKEKQLKKGADLLMKTEAALIVKEEVTKLKTDSKKNEGKNAAISPHKEVIIKDADIDQDRVVNDVTSEGFLSKFKNMLPSLSSFEPSFVSKKKIVKADELNDVIGVIENTKDELVDINADAYKWSDGDSVDSRAMSPLDMKLTADKILPVLPSSAAQMMDFMNGLSLNDDDDDDDDDNDDEENVEVVKPKASKWRAATAEPVDDTLIVKVGKDSPPRSPKSAFEVIASLPTPLLGSPKKTMPTPKTKSMFDDDDDESASASSSAQSSPEKSVPDSQTKKRKGKKKSGKK